MGAISGIVSRGRADNCAMKQHAMKTRAKRMLENILALGMYGRRLFESIEDLIKGCSSELKKAKTGGNG